MKYLFIDLFCGAGGVTTGIEAAILDGDKCAEVIACINHDPLAIASHEINHPHAFHFTEDIRKLDLTELTNIVRVNRIKYPDAIICLWASLECTNFSKAKGGLPRDADSRTLAEHLYRYIDAMNPDMIWIENVTEFQSWGPLDENGKPINKKNGTDFMRWVKHISAYGYNWDRRELNCADYGAYTSRIRLFMQFANPNFNNTANDIDKPMPTLMASRKHYYLLNPQYQSKGTSVEKPCFTLIARMDKQPPYLIAAENGMYLAEISADDSEECMKKIKIFMQAYKVVDIKMRMLRIQELKLIQGFSAKYYLAGNQNDQKKFIGNSVPPPMVQALIEASISHNFFTEKVLSA